MDYFDAFLLKKPQGKIIDGKINIGDGWASDCGIYEVCIHDTRCVWFDEHNLHIMSAVCL